MGKRQIAALETRRKVIAAAEKLISERGFENVMISDITKAAGVATGTFYTYFKRKEDVIGEIACQNFQQVREQAEKVDGDVCEQITSFLTESMQYIVDSGVKFSQQWVRNIVDPTESDGKEKLVYDTGTIKDMLRTAAEKGELVRWAPVEELARVIAAEYYGAVFCWCILDGAADPVALLKNYCQIQLKKTPGRIHGRKSSRKDIGR
ncbi:TetR/AcrR family transcriptional regulator [bacterium D16-76]|nr:TetR/AcrR family transcriptional regulator [bacterium D16-76]